MSQENVEIMRAILEPFNTMDIADVDWGDAGMRQIFETRYSHDVELATMASGGGVGTSRLYSGWDGLVRYMNEWCEPFSEYHLEALDFIDAGDRVIVPFLARGVGAGSGAEVKMELAVSYEFRDGLITRVNQYENVEEALQAASPSD